VPDFRGHVFDISDDEKDCSPLYANIFPRAVLALLLLKWFSFSNSIAGILSINEYQEDRPYAPSEDALLIVSIYWPQIKYKCYAAASEIAALPLELSTPS